MNHRDYGESDRLITFYTGSGGRLRGIAKGARRSRKRFANTFEPCSLVELTYRERRSLIWVEACKLLDPHLGLREDLEVWGYAAVASEVVLEMVPEGEVQPELFVLLRETLRQLSQDKDPLNVLLLFLLRFLDTMGYLPAFDGCGGCQRPVRGATRWWWHMEQGALMCPEHHRGVEDAVALDLGTLTLIRQLRCMPVEKIWRLHLVQEKKTLLLHAILNWIRNHIRKDLKSLRWLGQVQSA